MITVLALSAFQARNEGCSSCKYAIVWHTMGQSRPGSPRALEQRWPNGLENPGFDLILRIRLRLAHTSRFFVVELKIFCEGQIWVKFVGTSVCRTLAYFLWRLTAFKLGAMSISAMLEKTLVHVTLMTIPQWLRYARAPTNCLGPPHASRQGPTRRFEI